MNKALEDVPLATWQDYLRWNLASGFAPYLSSEFVEEDFAFNQATLQGGAGGSKSCQDPATFEDDLFIMPLNNTDLTDEDRAAMEERKPRRAAQAQANEIAHGR